MATAVAEKKPVVKPTVIGSTIDRMTDLREQKRALEAQVKVIEEEFTDLEEKLMAKFDAEGTTKGAGKKGSASITESIVGAVNDWEKFNAYVKKTGYFHLFQRRLSDAGVRELFEQGKKIPGVEPFNKRRLNLRSGV